MNPTSLIPNQPQSNTGVGPQIAPNAPSSPQGASSPQTALPPTSAPSSPTQGLQASQSAKSTSAIVMLIIAGFLWLVGVSMMTTYLIGRSNGADQNLAFLNLLFFVWPPLIIATVLSTNALKRAHQHSLKIAVRIITTISAITLALCVIAPFVLARISPTSTTRSTNAHCYTDRSGDYHCEPR